MTVRRLLFAFFLSIVVGVVASSVSATASFRSADFAVCGSSQILLGNTYDAGPNFSIGDVSESDLGQVAGGGSPPVLATRWAKTPSVAGLAAADSAATTVNIGDKIAGQIGDRGWTPQSVQDMVGSATQKYPVWDYTTGTAQPATAYATAANSYVVVNDATGEVVQVSDLNNPGWKPVWNDPRFQR